MGCKPSIGIDLHVHSTASDGTFTPSQLIALAKELNLGALAITDHDTIDGARQALACELPPNLAFLTGVEFSAAPPEEFAIRGSIHLLGYGFELDHPELNRHLQDAQLARKERNPRILKTLSRLGYPLTSDEVQHQAGDNNPVGRPHIAQALIARGWASDINDAFDRLLGTGKPAYIDKYRIPIQQAIDVIHDAGGLAVLAHPGLLSMDDGLLSASHLKQLTDLGLDGIEAYYPEHSPEQTAHFEALATDAGLLITGGTDFHGQIKPDTQLGVADGRFHVPIAVYHRLTARLQKATAVAATGTR